MNIFMWSGPRNISTALMRSFENRNDAHVLDEPFYAYYLYKTKKNHPLKNEIINKYPINEKEIISLILQNPPNNKKIYYQKHMTHHILQNTSINWIANGFNCFLIRDPLEVIHSYIQKNNLDTSWDIGFPNQFKIFQKVKSLNKKIIVINAKDILQSPKQTLKKLCNKLKISFDESMLKWPSGPRKTDGIWSSIWYESVQQSTGFNKYFKKKITLPIKHQNIYKECLTIYKLMNNYKI